jgi:DNA-binding SARP family transcriptional activator
MRFRVLGPLLVRTGAGWVPVAADQQRLVLSVLLTGAERVVSARRLIHEVWGERPPRTAVNTMHAYVMRLRRLLGEDGENVLVTRRHGYELMVGPDDVDVAVFQRRLALGRDALADDRPATAEAELSGALALWRGPALADVPASPSLTAWVAQVEQARLSAVEDRLGALLELDRHADALHELYRLTDEHPLRERLWAHLMLALYRCGRRGEALEAYQRARRVLVTELGLEPGPRLRELQLRILGEDEPAAAVAEPRPVVVGAERPPARVTPAQLPADVAGFTGRDDKLKHLDTLLAGDDDPAGTAVLISAIAGAAGIGKTALAVHWGNRVRDRFPDGQLYVNLRGWSAGPPVPPIQALASFLRALGVPGEQVPSDVPEAAALYRSLLAGKRVLVLLDNAAEPQQVRPLLPASAGCLALVTSRDRLGGLVALDGAIPLPLDVLTEGEAHDLLARLLGHDRLHAEPEAAADLAALCGYLPLALRIAAAILATRPRTGIAAFVRELRHDRLGGLHTGDDGGVRAAFDLSYRAQPDAARRLFRLFGLVPGPDLTAPAAAALTGTAPEPAAQLLDRLAAAHLVDEHAPDRYTLHDLLRHYAAERAAAEETEGDRRAALDRLHEHYAGHLHGAADLLYPEILRMPGPQPEAVRFGNQGNASSWVEAERANLIAAVVHTARHGPGEVAWRLADVLRGYLQSTMSFVDWQVVVGAALTAAESAGDRHAVAAGCLSHGALCFFRGDHGDALDSWLRAADVARQAGWAEGEAAAQGNIGAAYQLLGQLQEAADHLARSLAIRRRIGWEIGEAGALNNLGMVYLDMGRLEQAVEHYTEAGAIFRRLGAGISAGRTDVNRGVALYWLGRLDEAAATITPVVEVLSDAGDRHDLAYGHWALAELYRDRGDHTRALDLAHAAHATAVEAGNERVEAYALASLASVHVLLGDHRRAFDENERALMLAKTADDPYLEADTMIRAAAAQHGVGAADTATDLAHQGLALARQRSYRVLEGQALTVLAAIHLARGDTGSAVTLAEQALRRHTETGHRLGAAQTHLVAGHALRRAGRTAEADRHHSTAAALFAEVGADATAYTRILIGPVPRS